MTAEYPREYQNPPTEPGARPDEQPAPRQRVPKHPERRVARANRHRPNGGSSEASPEGERGPDA